jgi:hypothetical protein
MIPIAILACVASFLAGLAAGMNAIPDTKHEQEPT